MRAIHRVVQRSGTTRIALQKPPVRHAFAWDGVQSRFIYRTWSDVKGIVIEVKPPKFARLVKSWGGA